MRVWRNLFVISAVALTGAAFMIGFALGMRPHETGSGKTLVSLYSHGYQSKDFFDRAYEKAGASDPLPPANAALSAHHLLVADEIARVFEALKDHDGKTVVMVSPNHFYRGTGRAQVSFGSWETPYGQVDSDTPGAQKLLDALPFLHRDETAYPKEHGIAALTPFVAHSLPHSKVISIIVEDELAAEDAWTLGEQISTLLPDAVFIASVDMVHESSESRVAKYDPKIIATLEKGCSQDPCFEDYPIDSNAALRALLSFAHARGLSFQLSHEGSSMRMGVAKETSDNVSHILGVYFK